MKFWKRSEKERWHLLCVLERLSAQSGKDFQRIGLSATVGNPEELLQWLAGTSGRGQKVVQPPSERGATADVTLDYVGSLENAATVSSRLHCGEKRLVFCDSRSRVESLAGLLRMAGVQAFVSHLPAAGLLQLGQTGYVEPIVPPLLPYHIIAQQVLVLCLERGGLGQRDLLASLRRLLPSLKVQESDVTSILEHMLLTHLQASDGVRYFVGGEGETQLAVGNAGLKSNLPDSDRHPSLCGPWQRIAPRSGHSGS